VSNEHPSPVFKFLTFLNDYGLIDQFQLHQILQLYWKKARCKNFLNIR